MNEEQQQQNEEHRQMKIHIKNEQKQHKNLTGDAPKQVTSLRVFDFWF